MLASNDPDRITLHDAVINKDINRVGVLVNTNPSLVNKLVHYNTPLHLAAKLGYEDILTILLRPVGVRIDQLNEELYTALDVAVVNGHVNAAQLLIVHGANLDNALKLAITNARLNFIEILVAANKGLLGRVKDGEDPTPLFFAIMNGKIHSVKKLIELGANVNFVNDNGETPLFVAARKNASLDIIKLLLEQGADVNKINPLGQTAEMCCTNIQISNMLKEYQIKSMDINKQLNLVEGALKKKLEESTNDSQKQECFDAMMQTVITYIYMFQDHADKATIPRIGELFFNIANLITAVNQGNDLELNNVSFNLRKISADLGYPLAKNIMTSFSHLLASESKPGSIVTSPLSHFNNSSGNANQKSSVSAGQTVREKTIQESSNSSYIHNHF